MSRIVPVLDSTSASTGAAGSDAEALLQAHAEIKELKAQLARLMAENKKLRGAVGSSSLSSSAPPAAEHGDATSKLDPVLRNFEVLLDDAAVREVLGGDDHKGAKLRALEKALYSAVTDNDALRVANASAELSEFIRKLGAAINDAIENKLEPVYVYDEGYRGRGYIKTDKYSKESRFRDTDMWWTFRYVVGVRLWGSTAP